MTGAAAEGNDDNTMPAVQDVIQNVYAGNGARLSSVTATGCTSAYVLKHQIGEDART